MDFQIYCALIVNLEEVEQKFLKPWTTEFRIDIRIKHDGKDPSNARKVEILGCIIAWAHTHKALIHSLSKDDLVALLSLLFPNERQDMVYNLQPQWLTNKFEKRFREWLDVSKENIKQLRDWEKPNGARLSASVHKVMQQTRERASKIRPSRPITVSQVFDVLEKIAFQPSYSDPSIRKKHVTTTKNNDEALRNLFTFLRPSQGGILVKLLLNDLGVELNHYEVLRHFNAVLPAVYKVTRSFSAVAKFLLEPEIRSIMNAYVKLRKSPAYRSWRPVHDTFVDRSYTKQGSTPQEIMKHADKRRMFLERKSDGEYCQIHIDLSKGDNDYFVIFSKSGKRSTDDKKQIHEVIKESLGFSIPANRDDNAKGRRFKTTLMIGGELVVFNKKTREQLPFHYARKHLTRSGRKLGLRTYSPP